MKSFLRAFTAPIFFCLFFVLFLNLFFPKSVFASVTNISRIVFTTDEQAVLPNVISKIITIQTQNSSGTSEPLTETSDLSVVSSSPTGHFYSNSTTGSSTNTFTMSSSSSSVNKNFYYKDSSYGIFTITAKLKTRITGKTWTVTQNITVGDLSADSGNSTTTQDNKNVDISSHNAIEELTSSEDDSVTTFVVGAGRERVAYVGSLVDFKANYKQLKSLGENKKFIWNFGDGYSKNGEKVSHSYAHEGEYDVVLNAQAGNSHGSSRTEVTVLEPNLKMDIFPDESISLENLGEYEVNIGNFKLKSYYREYTFPLDTIIGVGKKIILDKECTKLSIAGNRVEFLNLQDKELLFFEPASNHIEQIKDLVLGTTTKNTALGEPDKEEIVSVDEASTLMKALILAGKENTSSKSVQVSNVSGENSEQISKVKDESGQSVSDIIQENHSKVTAQKANFWQRIISFPATAFYAIMRTFYQAD